jgi:phosphatidylglycerol---prolipoprotein diacylglyceryl transferase
MRVHAPAPATLAGTVPIAVIAFDFDPLLRLAEGLVVRWQTIALAAVIATALIVTALIARRDHLRSDDLLFIAIGTVPGAVIGGRIGYVLLHLDFYSANPGSIVDPGLGAMELALGVVGGLLSGAYVASLLGAPVGRWCRTAAIPLLFALAAGKLTMILGGAGQGVPSGTSWATAFLGPGPWGSLAPALPSYPSQAFEAGATVIALIVVGLIVGFGGFARRDGQVLFAAIGLWAFARAIVATSWRDEAVLAGLNMGSLIAIAVGVGSLVVLAVLRVRAMRGVPGDPDATTRENDLSWPDPATRPRF